MCVRVTDSTLAMFLLIKGNCESEWISNVINLDLGFRKILSGGLKIRVSSNNIDDIDLGADHSATALVVAEELQSHPTTEF